MKNNVIAGGIGIISILALLVMTSVTKSPVAPSIDPTSQQEVNLALREIADQLLRQNNDFTTLIPPIRRESEGTYLIDLGTTVNYFELRSMIDRILDRHHIQPDYRVSLLNCEKDEVVLGFLAKASDEDKEVPCQKRVQNNECYNIRLALIDNNEAENANLPTNPTKRLPWVVLGIAIGFPFVWLFWKQQLPQEATAVHNDGWLSMSEQTRFHPSNQMLKINDQSIDLTFREAKLLQFFFDHHSQVLERERILEGVWGDEGVIVGRSLDVFVSRLRKKLKADADIQITNVHGVGYKLMV